MRKFLVVLLLAALIVAPVQAWRGIGWNPTYTMPQLSTGGAIVQTGDVVKTSTGNVVMTFSADGSVVIANVTATKFITPATAAPASLTSTASGEFWMTTSSPGTHYVSDGAGSTTTAQANNLYHWNGTVWVPLYTGITP